MAFPNVSDIVATTIESRTGEIADNVTKNNALLMRLKEKGNIKPFSGGSVIFQELSFAQNNNTGYYSGYDLLPVAAQDVLSAAQYSIKQAAAPIIISGLEMLQNAGKQQMIDLMDGRLAVGEASMYNLLAGGVYADGTGSGGKEITGLGAAVPVSPTTGVYGGIDRSVWTFWRNQYTSAPSTTAATIQQTWNLTWAKQVRGRDRPDLIIVDSTTWSIYMQSLQSIQRFTDTKEGNLGFPTIKFMDADVVLDGGLGGFCPNGTAFFLNTDYIFWRPHSERNMVPLAPNKRYALNQDAEVQILAWAGNMTTSGAQFQQRWTNF